MITVARFSLAIEAHIARAKLESEGIPAFVADEHTVTAQWLYSNAIGGVRLQVPDSCAEEAKEILTIDYSESLIAEQGNDELLCPNCGSNAVRPVTKGFKMAFVVFLFLYFPLWPYKRKIECLDCKTLSDYKP